MVSYSFLTFVTNSINNYLEKIRKSVSENGGIAASLDMLASADDDLRLQVRIK